MSYKTLLVFTNITSFIYDAGLVEGEYICKSNYINYAEVLPGDRFEIQVTYHRKIDGKIELNIMNHIFINMRSLSRHWKTFGSSTKLLPNNARRAWSSCQF